MTAVDIAWMIPILAGAGYLFYRSVWKKRGHCQGCDGGGCGAARRGSSGRPGC
ncbi:FeoB-associated Cys-rich membrane protein [Deferrisoma sp.]